jgi:hypothetical protein
VVVPGPPSKATIWRVLTEVDAASVDAAVSLSRFLCKSEVTY